MVMIGARLVLAMVVSKLGKQKFLPFLAANTPEDHATLAELAESGALSPVIDRAYPIREVAEALRHVEQDHPTGKVVLTL